MHKEVYSGIFHYFLVQGTVLAPNVQRIFPALRERAWLILAISYVLPEVNRLLRDHFPSNGPFHVLKANYSVFILIKPIVEILNLSFIRDEAPLGDYYAKAFVVKVVLIGDFPHCERSFERLVLVEGLLDKSLFHDTLGDHVADHCLT